jgi:hypothetical protein
MLPIDGVYTVQVYMMRNEARRKEKADFLMDITIDGEVAGTSGFVSME